MSLWLQVGLPALFAGFLWWAATCAIVYLDGLPERTFKLSLLGAILLSAVAVGVIGLSSQQTTPLGALAGFASAIVLWGLNEIAFLMGYVTGPRPADRPVGSVGWPRLLSALEAIAYHEAALLVTLAFVGLLVWGAPNQVAFLTLLLLWSMRLLTKINIFLGVPHLLDEVLPARVAFLKSHFRKAPMTAFFPVSVTAATALALFLTLQISPAPEASFATTTFALLAVFAWLAVLEHWLMVLPISQSKLWAVGLASRRAEARREQVHRGGNRALDRASAALPATISTSSTSSRRSITTASAFSVTADDGLAHQSCTGRQS